mmetsp:Transcript_2255/g.5091  ORF Transcript_2255/g.5091 Transcript_2255/m.5091 type:complete len:270 (+) Transcript_2255:171-980(+)
MSSNTSNHVVESGIVANPLEKSLEEHDETTLGSSGILDSIVTSNSERSKELYESSSNRTSNKDAATESRNSVSDQSSSAFLRSTRTSQVFTFQKENRRSEKVMAELTINKLNIKSLGLIGRCQEISTLRTCFERLSGPKEEDDENHSHDSVSVPQNELVLISGYSGIGKSTLAQSVKKDVLAANGVYVEGKYKFTSIDEPYSGVAQAFGELCNKCKDYPPEVIDKITKKLSDTMQEEAEMLMGLIPEIGVFLGDDYLDKKTVGYDAGGS